MLFHSFEFILAFLPVVVVGYAILVHLSATTAKLWLILASFVFYGWAEPLAVPILAGSIVINFVISLRLDPDKEASGKWLYFALFVNILALGIFKYSKFAASNFNTLFGARLNAPSLLLPLGISFFTVQQIMFLVDRHQGIAPRQKLLDYTLFVSWFPYIVAGPITRWKDVLPQFQDQKLAVEHDTLARGVTLFILGLSKKVILSSAFAPWADTGFAHPAQLGFAGSWLTAIGYALQLYFDFSGYTDMARGAGLMFKVSLPENFNDPFRSRSIIEYWQRWHISLTNFITNYIYTPILRTGRRPTFQKAMVATMVTMVIAGAWHGASWCYVLFGAWHGLGLVINHIWRKYKRRMPGILAWGTTAAFVLVGFVLFRASTPAEAWTVLHSMFLPAHFGGSTLREMLADHQPTRSLSIVAGIGLLFYPRTSSKVASQAKLRPSLAFALAVCVFVCFVVMNSKPTPGFIYRQF